MNDIGVTVGGPQVAPTATTTVTPNLLKPTTVTVVTVVTGSFAGVLPPIPGDLYAAHDRLATIAAIPSAACRPAPALGLARAGPDGIWLHLRCEAPWFNC